MYCILGAPTSRFGGGPQPPSAGPVTNHRCFLHLPLHRQFRPFQITKAIHECSRPATKCCIVLCDGTLKNEQLTMSTLRSGADPAVRLGERFQYYLVVKSHNSLATVREIEYTSQRCCDKTMDDKMALYLECCFPNCTKLWWIKLIF